MSEKWNYTQVLSLISAQISRLEQKLDGVEDKLTADHGRITKLETESTSNLKWLGWAGWVLLAALEIYRTFTA
jgi:hypothetical protein